MDVCTNFRLYTGCGNESNQMTKPHVTACYRLYEEKFAGVCSKGKVAGISSHGRGDLRTGIQLGKVTLKIMCPHFAYCKLKRDFFFFLLVLLLCWSFL